MSSADDESTRIPANGAVAGGAAAASRPAVDQKALAWTLLVCSVLLAGLYVWGERLLPRGPAEFAYFPYLTDPLPFAPMRGFTFEQLARHLGRTFVLGPALVALSAALVLWRRPAPPSLPVLRRLTLLGAGLGLVLSALVMAEVLAGRALVDDELTYRWQAQLLSEGRLGERTVPLWGWEAFTIWTRAGATGKYLFGEPLVQIVGTLVGLPALLHLLLAPLTLWAWYRFWVLAADPEVACWATLLVALSPMFLLTTAVGLSHATTLFLVTCAGLGFLWAAGERPWRGALLVGTCLGFGLAVRPQVIAPIGLVLGFGTAWRLLRLRRWAPLAVLVGSGSLWVVLIALYNHTLTGSPTTLPWYLFPPTENYGFGHVGGIDFYHDLSTALENLVVTAVRFNGWWLGWPLSLVLPAAWLVIRRRSRGVGLWIAVGAALVIAHIPYYSTGISETGPVYYYELLLPAAALGAYAIVAAAARWPAVTMVFLAVHFGLGTTTFLAENVMRLERLMTTLHGPVEHVLATIEPPALLIHENAWAESVHYGWVWSFPLRYRSDNDPVVTYPRGLAKHIPLLRQRYADRGCWYYRIEPETLRQELFTCDDAAPLLDRDLSGEPPLRDLPTAERLGLLKAHIFARSRAELRAAAESAPPP